MAVKSERVRFKLFTAMLTTYGYALTGGTVLQAFISPSENRPIALLIACIFVGVALQVSALYIAPRGET